MEMLEVTYQGKTQRKHKISDRLADRRRHGQRQTVPGAAPIYAQPAREGNSPPGSGKLARPGLREQELEAFDVESLLSVGCLINVIHETRNGSTYANVASVMRLPKGMTAPTPRDYIRVCDRPAAATEGAEDGLGITDDDVPF